MPRTISCKLICGQFCSHWIRVEFGKNSVLALVGITLLILIMQAQNVHLIILWNVGGQCYNTKNSTYYSVFHLPFHVFCQIL